MHSLRLWLIVHVIGFLLGVWFLSAAQPERESPDGMSVLVSPSPKASSDFEAPIGTTPREAITGSRSGSTLGRPENPWDTRGKPQRGDQYD